MSGGNRYQSIFRAANFLGLFPVSGLFESSKKEKENLRPHCSDKDGNHPKSQNEGKSKSQKNPESALKGP